MPDSSNSISVEVAYALPEKQKIIPLNVVVGTTAFEAVVQSGIANHFEGLDVETADMGIFGNALGSKGLPPAKEYVLQDHDRVEIYRPLIADPKALRKERAAKARKKRGE